MKTNRTIGRSGGPTSVINMTSRGVEEEAYHTESIDQIHGMRQGLQGILGKEMISLYKKWKRLQNDRNSWGGSRYSPDETEYRRTSERIAGSFAVCPTWMQSLG